jgi:hypothetical protein
MSVLWKFFKGIVLKGETADISDNVEGSIWHNSTTNRLKSYLNAAVHEVTTNDQTQSLTHKTFDVDAAGNVLSNVADGNIKSGANIAHNKMAALTTSKALASDGSGVVSATSVTATELGYVSGVTSAIQGQFTDFDTRVDSLEVAVPNLQADIDNHIADTTDAHAGSAITNTPSGNLAATTVQGALNELQTDVDTRATTTALNAHINNTTGAHAASAISNSPSGNLSSTDAQSALNELQTDIDTRATSSALTAHTGASTGVHGVTGAVVGTTDTQALTNKDINGGTASNTSRITLPKAAKTTLDGLTRKEATIVYDTTGQKAYIDNGSTLVAIGTGSGGINYIGNPDAETDTTGWATYADAAGTSPVDGTGGSPTVTWTRSTSSPLRDNASFLLTKDAANRQGEGASYAFTIASADKGTVQNVTFEYSIASGTYADGDLTVYLFDVTNSRVIQPSGYSILNASVNSKQKATFQTSIDSTSYRLCFHVASTSASAYTIKLDTISVGPQATVQGAFVSDWIDFPSVAAGTLLTAVTTSPSYGTTVTNIAKYRRVGSNMEIMWDFRQTAGGSAGSGTYLFNLPPGYSIDTDKITVNTGTFGTADTDAAIGTIQGHLNAATLIHGFAVPYSATQLKFVDNEVSGSSTSSSGIWGSAHSGLSTGAMNVNVRASVPIAGWGSNVTYAADAGDGRVVAMIANTSNTAGSTTVNYKFSNVVADTHAAYSASTGQYTVPVAGYYQVNWAVGVSTNAGFPLYKNGVIYANTTEASSGSAIQVAGGSALVQCVVGDTLEVRCTGSLTAVSSATNDFFMVSKLAGPSAIAAAESVNATYSTTAAQSITTGSSQAIVFGTKEFDTHNAMNSSTGAYTVPMAGKYEVNVQIRYASSTNASESSARIGLNGTDVASGGFHMWTGVSHSPLVSVNKTINCVVGDVITGRAFRTVGTVALTSVAIENYISIKRVGN